MSLKEPLSSERIVQAALSILDEDGVAGLSMRRIGAALNVEAASLYHHIPNKMALIQKIIDTVSTRAALPSAELLSWPQMLLQFAKSYRTVLLIHPGVVPLAAIHPVSPEVFIELAAPLIREMETTSASYEHILFVIQSTAVFVIGLVLAEVGNWPEPPTAPSSYYDQWFDVGVKALVNGFMLQYESKTEGI